MFGSALHANATGESTIPRITTTSRTTRISHKNNTAIAADPKNSNNVTTRPGLIQTAIMIVVKVIDPATRNPDTVAPAPAPWAACMPSPDSSSPLSPTPNTLLRSTRTAQII